MQETSPMSRTRTATGFLEKVNPNQPQRAPLVVALLALLSSMTRGHLAVLHCHQGIKSVGQEPAEEQAYEALGAAITKLRMSGDMVDVDVRMLPVTWTLDLDWVNPPKGREVVPCFMCNVKIFQDAVNEHCGCFLSSGECDMERGVVPEGYVAEQGGGTSMGGTQNVICDLSASEIDPEDTYLLEEPLQYRPGRRLHSIDSDVDRLPMYHELVRFLHQSVRMAQEKSVPGAAQAVEILQKFDPYHGDTWVQDKQHRYWMQKYVKIGKDRGIKDTPASMITRACEAFAERPVFAMPLSGLVPDWMLPRSSPRTSLLDAAGIVMAESNGFGWISYADLGLLVDRVARGLHSLNLGTGAHVAIAGYNEIEWMVADFAVARAGLVSVGVHTTYSQGDASAVMDKAMCCALLTMQNLVLRGVDDPRSEHWCVKNLDCPTLSSVVLMDGRQEALGDQRWTPTQHVSSFLDWVVNPPAADLPDPFEAHGSEYTMQDGSTAAMMTLLFTSGSSGSPKAVAVGVDAFVNDVSGDITSGAAVSKSVTVSYIPLSHSSDRYKVWEHVVWGGRVAFCFFSAQHWEAHEKDKKGAMIEYASPIDGIFAQISAVKPTSMSCPPNIWAGLYDKYNAWLVKEISNGASEVDAAATARRGIIKMFGGKLTAVATGGAPTPQRHMDFAIEVCHDANCSFVNSYGTTECGAITSDGRQLGDKFKDIEMRLVDHPELGFTTSDKPFSRGEVVVSTLSLSLGYYQDPQKEAEAFVLVSEDHPCPSHIQPALPHGRWYFTGDLGMIDNTHKLTLIDRVSATCSTSEGILIRPSQVENAIDSIPSVKSCLALASPKRPDVIVIVRPMPNDESSGGLEAAKQRHILQERLDAAVDAHRYAEAEEIYREIQGGEDKCTAHGGDVSNNGSFTAASMDVGLREAIESTAEWIGLQSQLECTLTLLTTVDDWNVQNGMLSGELKKRRGALVAAYQHVLESS